MKTLRAVMVAGVLLTGRVWAQSEPQASLQSVDANGAPREVGVVAAEPQAGEKEKAFDMTTIVVTTSRLESRAVDAAQTVSVITDEQIMASPFERVEDIVRSMPGVYNYRHYGQQTSGIQSPLSMRGVGKNRVLILVDGVPQNDTFNNSISWVAWGHIPKENIERIEIVRGPSSALYGSEALGGVINIITKSAGPDRTSSLRAEAGTADTYGAHGFHSRTFGDAGVVVGGGYEESDGFHMVEDPAAYEIRRHRQVYKMLGKLSCRLSPETDLSLSALHYRHETGKGREFFYDDLTLNQFWLNLRQRGSLVDFTGLFYLNHADKTAYQDTATDHYASLLRKEEMTPLTWGGDIQGSAALGSGAKATVGLAYKDVSWAYDDVYVNSRRDVGAEGKQQFLAPFANADFRFFDESLLLNAGARYEWIRTSDGANWDSAASAGKPAYNNTYETETVGTFAPKMGAVWHVDERTTLRASAGKGFRAPSLFELYKVHVRQGGAYYREANPGLDPEEIWSFDAGVDRFLTDDLWSRVAIYRSYAQDYIGDRLVGTSTLSDGKTRYNYVLDNISEVEIYGVEAEMRWFVSRSLELFANYTYNVSDVAKDANNAEMEGNALPNEPRHAAHAGLNWRVQKGFDLSLIGNYYADIYFDNENTLKDDGHFTMDISLSRTLVSGMTVYVNGENVFDEEYAISRSLSASDTVAPGLIVTGGVKYAF
jgi:outer membrane receptor protein involved in Fe transport